MHSMHTLCQAVYQCILNAMAGRHLEIQMSVLFFSSLFSSHRTWRRMRTVEIQRERNSQCWVLISKISSWSQIRNNTFESPSFWYARGRFLGEEKAIKNQKEKALEEGGQNFCARTRSWKEDGGRPDSHAPHVDFTQTPRLGHSPGAAEGGPGKETSCACQAKAYRPSGFSSPVRMEAGDSHPLRAARRSTWMVERRELLLTAPLQWVLQWHSWGSGALLHYCVTLSKLLNQWVLEAEAELLWSKNIIGELFSGKSIPKEAE